MKIKLNRISHYLISTKSLIFIAEKNLAHWMTCTFCRTPEMSNLYYLTFIILGLVWLVGFYGISTFLDYLTPNPFLYK